MQINKIHIDAFGGLKDFTLCPSEGLNLILGDNERGKTTIMNFIRLMFYSDGYTGADLDKNIRKRYAPLDGTRMGGQIEFSFNGTDYTLSKLFGSGKRSDRVKLIDNTAGREVTLDSGEVGEKIFAMSADAFERSIYIGAAPVSSNAGAAELTAKLSTAAATGEMGDGFDAISDRLQKAIYSIHTKRGVGEADKLSDTLAALEKEKKDSAAAEQRARTLSEDAARKQAEQNALRTERDEAAKSAQAYRLASDRSAIQNELRIREETELIKAQLGDFDEQKTQKAAELYSALQEKMRNAEKLKEDLSLFGGTGEAAPSAEALLSLQNELDRLETDLKDIDAKRAETEAALGKNAGDKNGRIAVLWVLAAIFALSAVLGSSLNLLFLLLLIPAVVLGTLAAGAKVKIIRRKNNLLALREQLISLTEHKQKVEIERERTKSEYDRACERRRLLMEADEERENKKQRLSAELSVLEKEINDGCIILKNTTGTEFENTEQFLTNKRAAISRLETYGTLPGRDRFANDTTDALQTRFSKIPDIDPQISVQTEEKVRTLDEMIAHLEREIADARADSKNATLGHRSVAVIEREEQEKGAELSSLLSLCDALTCAKELLDEAYSEMRRQFAPELNRKVSELFTELTDGRYGGAVVSENLDIIVDPKDSSLPFESEYLSSGSRDQVDLCLRLALAELTAGGQRLPLLLDDVLMQYDDGRAERAMRFLCEYARGGQIIFFTCHGATAELARNTGANILKL